MPWVKIWIHFVWSTKNREPFLNDEIRQKVFQHIRENAREKGIHIDFINGYVQHVHCLISLGTDQTIEKIMQLIKGESSFWINKNLLYCNLHLNIYRTIWSAASEIRMRRSLGVTLTKSCPVLSCPALLDSPSFISCGNHIRQCVVSHRVYSTNFIFC